MRILVMGAGAIGSVFGGFLARAGHQVTLVGRPPHMKTINKAGLEITGIWGDHTVRNLKALTTFPKENSFDIILLTVKSYQTAAAMEEIRALAGRTPVLSLQNGLGNIETIAETVGADRTLGGRVIFGAETPAPGTVRVTVIADAVAIGPVRESAFPFDRAEEIARSIDRAGIPCRAVRKIERFIWGKVLYNAALNAPAAVLGVNYGKLLESEAARGLMYDIIREAFAVADAEGIELDWETPEEYREILFSRLIPPTASHFPSMLRDIQRGKRTEIDALNGALAHRGETRGIPTPVNRTLTRLILYREEAGASPKHRLG
ncbi:MAG: 2-dehydropantoate 2-reductase [Deltaproteobacteria bacterium]|nr:2-dehydropantoate 2-reductase [Deltaproteobacteria bacterium]